ncbi:MAG: hypothetical protein RLY71_1654 [Pseudomonadota bacterium]|jgi:hypothetical protein
MTQDSSFLARWSRRKVQARQGVPLAEGPSAQPVPAERPAPAPCERAALPPTEPTAPAEPAPTLADVAQLDVGAPDYSRFVARHVATEVKNAALKKLFSDPHFNVMDGLDIYIDDYSQPDPLSPGMLAQLRQSDALGLFRRDEPAAVMPAHTGPVAADAAEPTPATPATLSTVSACDPCDENPDLRLQPHDAAGRAGPEPRPGPDTGREC